MQEWNEAELRCLATIELLNHEQGWALDRATQMYYGLGLRPYLNWARANHQLRTLVINYHADHMTVEALQNQQHPQHHEAWSSWMRQVMRVLHSARLHWSSDIAVDADVHNVCIFSPPILISAWPLSFIYGRQKNDQWRK